MEKVFNKLVRDNIPDIIRKNNEEAITRMLDDEEYRCELYKKLLEEANEVVNADSAHLIEELSDVYEVLLSIASLEGKTIDDIIESANEKRIKRGGFEKRIFLIKTK